MPDDLKNSLFESGEMEDKMKELNNMNERAKQFKINDSEGTGSMVSGRDESIGKQDFNKVLAKQRGENFRAQSQGADLSTNLTSASSL